MEKTMKSLSRQRGALTFALLIGLVLGCKSTTTSTSNSTSNNREDASSSTVNSNSRSNAGATSATTPDIAGKYNITGSNPDGGQYKGTLEVITRGDVYQFRWNAGTQYDGVGIQNGDIIAVAFANGPDGKGCGVVDYDIGSDGSLTGKWGYWGVNDAGTESATRTSGSGLVAEYDATGRNPDGKQYHAHLTVEPAGNLFHFSWSNNTDGVGIKRGNNVAVGIGGQRCGFVVYQARSDGSLDGLWGGGGSDKTGTEKATKQ
jgi:hypothetical protein